MKKMMVLFNPSSGKGRALKHRKTITQQLSQKWGDMDFIVTKSEAHLRHMAASAVKTSDQYIAIIGVGGDTTFNIIATEILKYRHTSAPGIAFGMIGAGSANDITRGLGLKTVDAACQAIINGHIKKIDVGCVKISKKRQPLPSLPGTETFFFLGTLSLGLGVTVNRYVDGFQHRHKLLSTWKPFDQLFPALYAIYDSFSKKKLPMRVEMEFQDLRKGENIKLPVKFSLLVLLNTPFYANGLQLGKDNGMTDGLLDCCIIETNSFLETFRDGMQILKRKCSPDNNITLVPSTWYKIISPESIDIQVDGEIIEGIREIEVSLIPSGLDVFSISDSF